jgi:hypothetical protein
MRIYRNIGLALVALVMAVTLACGDDAQSVAYSPAAYGEQVQLQPGQQYATAGGQVVTVTSAQNSWVCYFVDSPLEVVALQQAGLCPNAWLPMLMSSFSSGLLWHERYSMYYDGGGYYNRYVPSSYRSTYVQHVTVFENHYHTQIIAQQSSAAVKWKGSDGKVQTGATVSKYVSTGKASFGTGNVRAAPPAALKPAGQSSGATKSGGIPATAQTGGFSGGSRSNSSRSSSPVGRH